MLELADHGRDVFVGTGPQYPWGGLYGGQIVAQALVAASATVPNGLHVHSLRAYFIRRGDHDEPVRYEVDRIRDGRSFVTRRVVARQAVGAILNLEASFQHDEPSVDVEMLVPPPALPAPEVLERSSWSPVFDRAFVPAEQLTASDLGGRGRATAWLRAVEPLGDERVAHAAALAYLSDDLPTDAVVQAHPVRSEPEEVRYRSLFTASLDHTIWFHRPLRADVWHLHDVTCHTFVGGRGLSLGHVFSREGTHVATVAQ
ncbi:MAG: thioesterase family protein, partial [Actinobacteria bacterium]|nr:thioesterase family protein [Actinomycetota bacterium]